MSIKMIFGLNGEGKTLYKEKMIQNKNIGLNSLIEEWEIDVAALVYSENKIGFSHYVKIEEDFNRRISKEIENFYSANSSVFNLIEKENRDFMNMPDAYGLTLEHTLVLIESETEKKKCIAKLKALYENLGFSDYKDWMNWEKIYKEIQYPGIGHFFEVGIQEAFDLYEVMNKNKKVLDASEDQIEAALLLIQMLKIKNENFTSQVLELYSSVEKIKSELKNLINDEDLLAELTKMNATTLKKIKSTPRKKTDERIRNTFKSFAIRSTEYKNISKLVEEKIEKLSSAILFDKLNPNVREDGKILLVDRHLSAGQRVIEVVLEIIKSTSIDVNEIYLDDIYEKLDSDNIDLLTYKLSSLQNPKVTLLFHSDYIFERVADIFEDLGINVEFKKLKIKFSNGQKPDVEIINTNRKPLTFEKFNGKIIDHYKDNPNIPKPHSLLFSRLFGRYTSKAGAVSNLSGFSNPFNTSNVEIYNFVSQNIKHYEPKISLKKFNELFNQNLSTNEEFVDSIKLLSIVSSTFDDIKEFNVDFSKVKSYINQLCQILEFEKKIWEAGLRPEKTESKHAFIKKNWQLFKNSDTLNIENRNEIVHKLDLSISSVLSE